MSKMKILNLKVKRFFILAEKIKNYKKILKDLAELYPCNDFISKELENKTKKLIALLPNFNDNEINICLKEYKSNIKKLGICFCKGEIIKLPSEWFCNKCDRLYYEG